MGEIQRSSGSGLRNQNKLRIDEFRKNVMESGVCEMLLQMALTGREYFIDPTTNECYMNNNDDGMISQAERLKIMTSLVNKVLPAIKDAEEQEEQKSLLADIAKKLGDKQ